MRTRVKICGITRVEDALHAAFMGADAIGLVFYHASPRHVTIAQAQRIVAKLPAFVSVVGLFVDAPEETIRNVLYHVSLDCLQFHGHESPDMCNIYDKPYIKAVHMQPDTDISSVADFYRDASALLLDTFKPGIMGGSGQRFDWNYVPQTCPLPIILAGGLSPDNAQEAIRSVKPYALDVSSGVEVNKGIKDHNKITDFLRATHQATPG